MLVTPEERKKMIKLEKFTYLDTPIPGRGIQVFSGLRRTEKYQYQSKIPVKLLGYFPELRKG